jgi:hypothetical protein
MLPVTVRRVLMAQHRVDFRKRFDGLLAEAYRIGADPYGGDCVNAEGRVMPSARLSPDGLQTYLAA